MLVSNDPGATQIQLNIVENCTSNDRVKINGGKTEILMVNGKRQSQQLFFGKENLKEHKEIKHLGIERTQNGRPNINNRIAMGRATTYSLMGAGLHGLNGLNPLLAYKLWRVYVIPRILHGIEVLKVTKSDIQKLESFQKKTFKQFLSLPQRTADPALFILLGAETIEQIVDKMTIGLFLRIIKNEDTAEANLAYRQLAIKDSDSNSWFVKIQSILQKYELPSAQEITVRKDDKDLKNILVKTVNKFWREYWIEEANKRSTLKYMNTLDWNFKDPNLLWNSVRDNSRDIQKAAVKCRVITGTYMTQSRRAKVQTGMDPACPLCGSVQEDIRHMLIKCQATEPIRSIHRSRMMDFIEKQNLSYLKHYMKDDETLLILLTDCSRVCNKKSSIIDELDSLARNWIYAIHVERLRIQKQSS